MGSQKFDRSKEYNDEIADLVKRLKDTCTIAKIPFFFTACLTNDEDGSKYVNEGNLCGSGGFELTDDRITRHVGVAMGLDVIANRDNLQIMMDDPDELMAVKP